MKFSELLPLAGALLNLFLALFILYQNPRSAVARVYFLLGTSFAVWNYGTFWMFRVSDAGDALFWARFLQCGVIFLPLALFHLSLLIAKVEVRWWQRSVVLMYGVGGLLLLANIGGYFVSGVRNVGYAWYSVAGPGFWIWSWTLFPFFLVSLFILIRTRKSLPPLHRRRLTPLIIVQAAFVLCALNDVPPILGADYYPFTNIQIYPVGSMGVIFYGMIVASSVLQHQLFDVQVTLGRIAAKLVRMLFLFLVGFVVLLLLALIAPDRFTFFSFFSGLAALIVGAACASTLFPRLFGDATEHLERRILGDRFEYHDKIREFIDSMQWHSDRTVLFDDLHQLLVNAFRVQSYQIILFESTNREYSLFRSHPAQDERQIPDLDSESPIFRYFDDGKADYLAFNIAYSLGGESAHERRAREQLECFHAEFCFPFVSENTPIGLLLLGDKLTREPYTSTDLALIVTLVKNLSLVIDQIRLKNQILQAQEMELLGRMSRGMAHDLNNLLTPTWTFLQLVSEGAAAEDLREELLPVALRNVKTMRAYIREALFFSEHLRPDLQLGRLDVLIAQAVELAEPKGNAKGVLVEAHTAGEALVEMDEVLIQRLIGNLLANAIDASPAGSTVRVELVRLAKIELNRDWLRLRIIDTGEGIRSEDLNRIFTPYFTTKNRGDEERGFGLGLAICRKIIHLHGGHLSVNSQLHKGTVVQVDIPSRQIAPIPPTAPTLK